MDTRAGRAVGLLATVVVGLGMVTALHSGAAPRQSSDPQFVKVRARSAPVRAAGPSAARAAVPPPASPSARVRTVKRPQVLQSLLALQGVGAGGLSLATGPQHVVQVGGPAARILRKATGKVKNRSIHQMLGVPNTVTISTPTIAYDPLGKRWLLAAIAEQGGDTSIAFRVSRGRSPLPSRWFPAVHYGTIADDGRDVVEAAPKIGVSGNKVAITSLATDPGDAAVANRILILPKPGPSGLYRDGSADAWTAFVNHTYDGQLPAVNASRQANLFIGVPDTNDVTVTTYTGAAKANPPGFSKSVTYPATALLPPPSVAQGSGGDVLDLGPLAFTGAAWRGGRFWGAASTDCGGQACVRVFGIRTGAGVVLIADRALTAAGRDWFSPSLAVDAGNAVQVAVTDVGSATGPSLGVLTRRTNGSWTGLRLVRAGRSVVDAPPAGGSTSWVGASSAAVDPTSPWDVWITGAAGDDQVSNGLTSRVARVSLAKNRASLSANRTRVHPGQQVRFTAKLSRPASRDTIRGLPVLLQVRRTTHGQWTTLRTGTTRADGTARWSVRVNRTGFYRTVGRAVAQTGSPRDGVQVARVNGPALRIRLR